MALNKPVIAKVSEELDLKCVLCTEEFKSPKILQCLHSFCEQCIHEYILSTVGRNEKKVAEFNCPVCRAPNKIEPIESNDDVGKWASGLRTNCPMEMKLAMAEDGETKQLCAACKRADEITVKAVVWCGVCQEPLCESCLNVHRKLKISASHDVMSMEKFYAESKGLDLQVLQTSCKEHPEKDYKLYCFDHHEFVCKLCALCSKHKQCTDIVPLGNLMDKDNLKKFTEHLEFIQNETKRVLTEKGQEKEDLKKTIETAKNSATEFFEDAKNKLECFFESSMKQLNILHDEKNASLNVKIRLLEQTIKILDHWIEKAEVVKKVGTTAQLLLFMTTVNSQIKAAILELDENLQNDFILQLKFCADKKVNQFLEAENIGTFPVTKEILNNQISILYTEARKKLDIRFGYPLLDVEFVTSFEHKGSHFACGTCIRDNFIAVGNRTPNSKVVLVDKRSGEIVHTSSFSGDCCDLCYTSGAFGDHLFVSCSRLKSALYRSRITKGDAPSIEETMPLKFATDFVGSMTEFENKIYIVVNGAIKQFPVYQEASSTNTIQKCFSDYGISKNQPGIGIFEDTLVYITKYEQIKRAKLNGKQIYCYRNSEIKSPTGLAVLPSGATLVLDEAGGGSLFIVSKDGTGHRKLLSKFQRITNPSGLWLDIDKTTFYVVGGEYIEVYKIYGD